ncbi:MAG TPA: DUF6046 domain-containing protein [Chitinophagaceae bacterium]|jgi:hypothetical protein|nr:DUF6046 domain-containing protein [Chitinophagaceae bacterium]
MPNPDQNQFLGRISQDVTRDRVLYQSPLGTPVYTDLTFKGANIQDPNGKTFSFQDVKLATVLIAVTQTKVVERTRVQGRDGTVKEYFGMDDYQVQITGILTGKNGSYPYDLVKALKNVCDVPAPVEVVSDYLRQFGIFNLVIENSSFDQEPGGYSKQNFSLQCVSDMPVELEII